MNMPGPAIISCVGGMDARSEARALEMGAHIVVGTPGRLRDHLERRRLVVTALKAVVLDEADEMLDLGFREDLGIHPGNDAERTAHVAVLGNPCPNPSRTWRAITSVMPGASKSSATRKGHADIDYRAVRVSPREIDHAVVNILRFVESPSALVFCNTRATVRASAWRALSSVAFQPSHSPASLARTSGTMRSRRCGDGRARVCVATDVAARGIDLPIWISSSMPSCRTTPKCSSTAAAAQAAPAARVSASCWCRRRAAAGPNN